MVAAMAPHQHDGEETICGKELTKIEEAPHADILAVTAAPASVSDLIAALPKPVLTVMVKFCGKLMMKVPSVTIPAVTGSTLY